MQIRALDNRIIAVGKNSQFKLLSTSTALSRIVDELENVKVEGQIQ